MSGCQQIVKFEHPLTTVYKECKTSTVQKKKSTPTRKINN